MSEVFKREPIREMSYTEAVSICFCLSTYASNYIKEERTNIEDINNNVRDAVVVDAINYIGRQYGFEFGLPTQYLYSGIDDDEKVDNIRLLNVMLDKFEKYLLEENIEESILEHQDLNNCKFGLEEENAKIVLFDFMDYVSNINGYDIQEDLEIINKKMIKEKYHDKDSIVKILQRLESGETPEEIYEQFLEELAIAIISYYDVSEQRRLRGLIASAVKKVKTKNDIKK